MTTDWLFRLIFPSILLGWAWFSSRMFKSWLAPSAFWSAYWGAVLMIPLLEPNVDYWLGASGAILMLSFAFGLNANLYSAVSVLSQKGHFPETNTGKWVMPWRKQILLGCVFAGFISVIILIFRAGYSLSVFLHPKLLLQIGLSYASRRYAYGESVPIVIFLNAFMYLGGFIGGAWFGLNTPWQEKFMATLVFIPGLLQAILVNARTGMIWLFIFFISSYLATLVLTKRHKKFLTFKRILLIAACLGMFVGFYYALQSVRYAPTAALQTRVSMISPPYVFSYWLRENWDHIQPSWGVKTLNGIFSLLGFSPDALGWEGHAFLGYTPNAYTAFRQLIEDFTISGSLLFLFGLGAGMGMVYHKVLRGNSRFLPILALFYAIVLGSYLSNWLNYTSLCVAWLMFAGISYFFPIRYVDSTVRSDKVSEL